MAAKRKDVEQSLILALSCGNSIAIAAERAGCGTTTVKRRMSDPEFRQKVHEARAEMTSAAIGRLASLGVEAADELGRLMHSSPNDSVRVGAARSILQHMLGGHQLFTLAALIESLQSKIAEIESRKELNVAQQISE